MSIRMGMRAMGRTLGKVAPPVWPELIFSEDFDWKEEPPTFAQVFTEDFSGWP